MLAQVVDIKDGFRGVSAENMLTRLREDKTGLSADDVRTQSAVVRSENVALQTATAQLQEELKEAAKSDGEGGQSWRRKWAAFMGLAEVILLTLKSGWTRMWQTIQDIVSATVEFGKGLVDQVVNQDSYLRKFFGYVQRAVGAVADVASWFGSMVWSALKYLGSLVLKVLPKAVDVGLWISQSPTSARMTLVMVKVLKAAMCKQLAVWWMTTQEQRRQNSELNVKYFDAKEMLRELSGPLMTKVVSDVAKSKAVDSAVTSAAKVASKALESIPFVGGILAAVTDVATETLKESVLEGVQFYTHYTSMMQSVALLWDLLDPQQCAASFQQQAKLVEIIVAPSRQVSEHAAVKFGGRGRRIVCRDCRVNRYLNRVL